MVGRDVAEVFIEAEKGTCQNSEIKKIYIKMKKLKLKKKQNKINFNSPALLWSYVKSFTIDYITILW